MHERIVVDGLVASPKRCGGYAVVGKVLDSGIWKVLDCVRGKVLDSNTEAKWISKVTIIIQFNINIHTGR